MSNTKFYPYDLFQGTLKKIQLISDNLCYGPCPEPTDEIEQHLTMLDDGRVWLTRYCYGTGEYKLLSKETYKVSSSAMKTILDAITDYFSKDHDVDRVTDCGSWDLILTNEYKQKLKASGSVFNDSLLGSKGLSEIIRTNLDHNDLFVFDGNIDDSE